MTENEQDAIRWAITATNSHIKTNESFLELHAIYANPKWMNPDNPKVNNIDADWLQKTRQQCEDAQQKIQTLRAHRAALLGILARHNPIGDMIYEGRGTDGQ